MKHAFIIIAHNNYSQLARLVRKLDHRDNKLFIHIDAKSVFTDADKEMLRSACAESEIFFTKRYNVTWGGYSQAKVTMSLLETIVASGCDYYHLMSGADFPIKPMAEIHDFFERYSGTEFIHFSTDEFCEKYYYRVAFYHPLREKYGRNRKSVYFFLEHVLIRLQRLFRVDRTKKFPDIKIMMGSNWFSITKDLARYLLEKRGLIEKLYRHTVCCDESFVQTVAYNSDFKDRIYFFKDNVPEGEASLRSIDWSRKGSSEGAPYDYIVDDYEELVSSKNLFARKINAQTEKGNGLLKKLELL